jgi:WhiB family redox-sensing transcriptional regulator
VSRYDGRHTGTCEDCCKVAFLVARGRCNPCYRKLTRTPEFKVGERWAEKTRDTEWILEAACSRTDPNQFHAYEPAAVEAARKVCAACPVRDHCLADALATYDWHGIRGGLTGPELKALGKKLRAKAVAR